MPNKISSFFKGKTRRELEGLSDKELVEGYTYDYNLPRESKTTFAQFQTLAGVAEDKEKVKWEITRELIEIERTPGCICKFCVIQYLEPSKVRKQWKIEGKYIRFYYSFLLFDEDKKRAEYKPGGQTTLIAPINIARKITSRFLKEM